MYIDNFEQFGLSPNEARLYDVHFVMEETFIRRIFAKVKARRHNVYDVLIVYLKKT